MTKPTAKIIESTSAVKLSVPVVVAGKTSYLEFAINLMSFPKALEGNPDAGLELISKAVDQAMTGMVSVETLSGDKKTLDMPVSYVMSHAIQSKLKGK